MCTLPPSTLDSSTLSSTLIKSDPSFVTDKCTGAAESQVLPSRKAIRIPAKPPQPVCRDAFPGYLSLQPVRKHCPKVPLLNPISLQSHTFPTVSSHSLFVQREHHNQIKSFIRIVLKQAESQSSFSQLHCTRCCMNQVLPCASKSVDQIALNFTRFIQTYCAYCVATCRVAAAGYSPL